VCICCIYEWKMCATLICVAIRILLLLLSENSTIVKL